MPNSYRQEVLNVLLAQLLQERGVITAPESIIKCGLQKKRRMPDIIVNFNGLRTIIEGEISDHPSAESCALKSAYNRVEEALAHISLAIVYPAFLRKVDFGQLKSELSKSKLKIAIVTESGDSGFIEGDVDYLESILRHAFEQLVKEDIVAKAVAFLDEEINIFANVIETKAGVIGRIANALGIHELPSKESKKEK